MKRLLYLVAMMALFVPSERANAEGGPYGWTISTSDVDPYQNTGTATAGIRTLYLWYTCSTPQPNGPGGMASATFKINSTSISHLATTPVNGFLNAGSTNDLLLAVGACPTGPVVAANLLVLDLPGGSMCFAPSEIKAGLIGTVDCNPSPELHPMEWIGYDNTGAAPCSKGAATCVPQGPNVDAGDDQTICSGVPTRIGGDPTAQGGEPPYTYSWSPTAGLDDPTIANPTATVTTTTAYTVTVTDAAGDTRDDDMTLTVNAKPVADAGSDATVCADSSVEIGGTPTGAGGLPPYTYSWSPTEGLSNPFAANPGASPTVNTTYTVTVTDQNGCSDTAEVTVSVSEGVTVDAGADVEIVAGGSTTIGGDPTASGGTPPYTYDWTPADGLDDATIGNPTASPTATTTYVVMVTDSDGCTGTDSVTVTVSDTPELIVDAGADAAFCDGGSATIGGDPAASGGTPPYTYSWSPTDGLDDASAANPTASPMETTTYTLTVTDGAGASASDMVEVAVYPNPSADAGADVTILPGASTTIGGSPTGSGGTGPYTYAWSPTDGLDDPSAANPSASPAATTTYTVVVTDANGCEGAASATVAVEGETLSASAGDDVAFCAGGSAAIGGNPTGAGGEPPYTYSWSPADGLDDPSAANPLASPAETQTYTVTVTDEGGDSASDEVTVTVYPNPMVDAGDEFKIEEGGSIAIGGNPTASGGTGPYSYSWSPMDGLDDPGAANPNASPSQETTYTVTVTDANGCEGSDSAVVLVNPAGEELEVDAGIDPVICAGDSAPIGGSPTASGGTPPYTYSWDPTSGLDDPGDSNPIASPMTTTTYTVTVTDANGAMASSSMMVLVNDNPIVDAGPDLSVNPGESATLGGDPTASGGTPPYEYSWSPSTGLNDPTAANPSVSLTSNVTYTVTVTDANGCTGSDAARVTVSDGQTAMAVTPDGLFVYRACAFGLDVAARGVSDLGGFQADLAYDESLMRLDEHVIGPFLGSTGRSVLEVGPILGPGNVTFGAVSFGNEAGASGDGTLVEFSFTNLLTGTLARPLGRDDAASAMPVTLQLENFELVDTQGSLLDASNPAATVNLVDYVYGDFNNDCTITVFDIMQVAARWGTTPGDGNYDPAFDVNLVDENSLCTSLPDGEVDVQDIQLVAARFQTTCDDGIVLADAGPPSGGTLSIALDPPRIRGRVGELVEVDIVANGAQSLGAFELELVHDSSVLEIVDVRAGAFLGSTGNDATLLEEPRASGRQAVHAIGGFSFGFGPGAEGSGKLGTVTLRITDCGSSELTLRDALAIHSSGSRVENVQASGGEVLCGRGPSGSDLDLSGGLRLVPNPFTERTEIFFEIRQSGLVSVEVFDVTGRRVREVAETNLGDGTHTLSWDGRNDLGQSVPAGIYFVKVSGARTNLTKKVVVAR